jgi:hypothetical protein
MNSPLRLVGGPLTLMPTLRRFPRVRVIVDMAAAVAIGLGRVALRDAGDACTLDGRRFRDQAGEPRLNRAGWQSYVTGRDKLG